MELYFNFITCLHSVTRSELCGIRRISSRASDDYFVEFPDVDFLAGKTGSAGSMREVILGGIVF